MPKEPSHTWTKDDVSLVDVCFKSFQSFNCVSSSRQARRLTETVAHRRHFGNRVYLSKRRPSIRYWQSANSMPPVFSRSIAFAQGPSEQKKDRFARRFEDDNILFYYLFGFQFIITNSLSRLREWIRPGIVRPSNPKRCRFQRNTSKSVAYRA